MRAELLKDTRPIAVAGVIAVTMALAAAAVSWRMERPVFASPSAAAAAMLPEMSRTITPCVVFSI